MSFKYKPKIVLKDLRFKELFELYNSYFHKKDLQKYFQNSVEDFEKQVYRDVLKEHLLEKNGFEVIEIYEKNMPLKEKWIESVFGSHIIK